MQNKKIETEDDSKVKKEMIEVVTLLNRAKVPFNLLNTLRRRIALEFVKMEEESGVLIDEDDHGHGHDHNDNIDISIIEPFFKETIGPMMSDKSR